MKSFGFFLLALLILNVNQPCIDVRECDEIDTAGIDLLQNSAQQISILSHQKGWSEDTVNPNTGSTIAFHMYTSQEQWYKEILSEVKVDSDS